MISLCLKKSSNIYGITTGSFKKHYFGVIIFPTKKQCTIIRTSKLPHILNLVGGFFNPFRKNMLVKLDHLPR